MEKRKTLIISTAMMLLAGGSGWCQEAPAHTVYFLGDNAAITSPSDVYVHVWENEGADYLKWALNENMQLSGRTFTADDGKTYDVYEYSFGDNPEWTTGPTNIIFHPKDGNTSWKATGNLKFVEGGLYNSKGKVQEYGVRTVFFCDVEGWGADAVTLSGPRGIASAATPMELTYTIAGVEYPVYAFTIAAFEGEQIEFANSVTGSKFSWTVAPDVIYVPEMVEPQPWKPIYTVYFYDKKVLTEDADVRIHVWDANSSPVYEWPPQIAMTFTGKYYFAGSVLCPVYSCSFEWNRVPAGILFLSGGTTTSADYVFVNEGLYTQGQPVGSRPVVDFEYAQKGNYRVYFVDTAHWGADATQVHVWNSTSELSKFDDNETMQPSGKYYQVGDVYAPVYYYDFEYWGQPANVIFHKKGSGSKQDQTGDLDFINSNLYYFAGGLSTPEPIADFTLLDDYPHVGGTIYINLGANQLMQNLWAVPCAHLTTMGDFDVPAYGSDQHHAEEMEMVRPGLYKIEVDDLYAYSDIVFYYYGSVPELGPNVFPASRSQWFDPTAWATYIYDIGTDCAHQTYLTPERYSEIEAVDHNVIFMSENNVDPINAEVIAEDDGVFFRKFSFPEPADDATGMSAEFKLSWVDVKGEFERLDGQAYSSQRGWNTFNLGIIGCDDSSWIISGDQGQSRRVGMRLNSSVRYNNYNQYIWSIQPGRDGAVIEYGRSYWLVVDTHDDDRSVTLVDFDPNPVIGYVESGIRTETIGYERALQADHSSASMLAAEAEGQVYFDRVNIASGDVVVQAAPGEESLGDNYGVDYYIYVGGELLSVYNGVPSAMTLSYMVPGSTADLAVRARYTDKTSGKSFCSRYSLATVEPQIALEAPEAYLAFSGLVWGYGSPVTPGNTMYDAAMHLTCGIPDNENRACYLDFTAAADGALPGSPRLTHAGEPFLGSYPAAGWTDHTPWDGQGEYGDSNNWSKLAAQKPALHLPVYLDGVLDRSPADTDFQHRVVARVFGVYPFLVAPKPVVETSRAGAPRKVARDAAPADLTGYRIVAERREAEPVEAVFSAANLSGLTDTALAPDAEVEYFTVDGVRISAPSAPGIYIERRGSIVRKIITR